ncbi:universal stress protein [Rhodococcus sp. AQ5-07]|uniref:universal stress protein n=1 Tax=Rhodococcus sp. AQ5-07 TaxID=2054902 RepID=UPI000DC0538D|nr:universal stress protein [Rhodococcus sp. AQ5-07]RAL31632.1 universal stress protein [Rhodococcus sp. AQ5-07]
MMPRAPIVVGVDGSASSIAAVRWAAREASLRSLPLHLVTAMLGTPETFGNAFRLVANFPNQDHEGQQRLSAARSAVTDECSGSKVPVTEHLGYGHAVDVLLKEGSDCSILVVGSHGSGQLAGELLGSVSSAVAAHARVPVAIIRGTSRPGKAVMTGPVVVGVDGTANSEPAIAEAFESASLRGAALVAVHAWTDVDLATVFQSDPDGVALNWGAIESGERAVLSESLAGWSEKFADVKVKHVVVRDRPVHALVSESQHAQLVVVGSRGRGGFTSMMLGSTSRRLMHSTNCPVLIVHSPKAP